MPKSVKISFNTTPQIDNCLKEDVENSHNFTENKTSVMNKILFKHYEKKDKKQREKAALKLLFLLYAI